MAKKKAKTRTKAPDKKAAFHAAFVEAYLCTMPRNGKRAYLRVNPDVTEGTAEVESSKLLRNPQIVALIEQRQQEMQKALEITTERVLAEVARLAFVDIRNLYHEDGTLKQPHELDDNTAAAIQSIDVEALFDGRGEDREHVGNLRKYKLVNKAEPLRDLMKHLGLFEKDNKQKTDPIRDLLAAIDGRSKLAPPGQ